ncbi:Hypothetical predicted protein [Podarcis lilfordi]|uniref:VWFC domain-containing protein n=1 Tax=Podarcis lilfordi TaxID=74358 RepID=A0AA35K8I4_9SAUR|nr:Hypothetical predicted protein [Podarcis lilfordi]
MKPKHFLCLLLSCCFLQNGDCKHHRPDCTAVLCLACPDNHKAVTRKDQCCPRCIPQCKCPAFLKEACIQEGYEDGILLLGQSVIIDFGTRKCTCGEDHNIVCASTCPKISPACKYIGRPQDGCGICACPTDDENFVPAGEVIERECKICKCPPNGGQLQCTLTSKCSLG